jgi:tRNA threonylcarbamoyladenosine biosynthesis protein TsaB
MGFRTAVSMALDSPSLGRLMKILAIDTAGWKCSVALWEDNQEISFQEKSLEKEHAALLPHLVKEIMDQHKIDELIVNIGPGSFTGIRLGIAFAKGLSLGWGIPLRGINSFAATFASLEFPDDVLVLIEARRADVYAQRFLKGIPQDVQSLTRQDLEKILLSPHPPLLAGSGIHPFLEGLIFQEVFSPWQGAQKLAHVFFKNPELSSEPHPFYAREADVTCSPLP